MTVATWRMRAINLSLWSHDSFWALFVIDGEIATVDTFVGKQKLLSLPLLSIHSSVTRRFKIANDK
jgi:hypothetical protein